MTTAQRVLAFKLVCGRPSSKELAIACTLRGTNRFRYKKPCPVQQGNYYFRYCYCCRQEHSGFLLDHPDHYRYSYKKDGK
eukprot:4816761-Amphidinium_carterae.1